MTELELQSYDKPEEPAGTPPSTIGAPGHEDGKTGLAGSGGGLRRDFEATPLSGGALAGGQSYRERLAQCRARLARAEELAAKGGERRIVCAINNPILRGSGMNAEEAREHVVKVRRECDEIEDEARRMGVPPGFLR